MRKTMATDLAAMIDNLMEFYNFGDKTVLSIGAGGGQFYEYASAAKHIIAVDNDKKALAELGRSIDKAGFAGKFTLIHSDFYDVREKSDLLMFDFCLHEIPDPRGAISHGLTLCADLLVNDHWPGSPWAFAVDEEEKVMNSWEAVNEFKVRKIKRFDAVQVFKDYDELHDKVRGQGNTALMRIERYLGQTEISIPMSYGFALI